MLYVAGLLSSLFTSAQQNDVTVHKRRDVKVLSDRQSQGLVGSREVVLVACSHRNRLGFQRPCRTKEESLRTHKTDKDFGHEDWVA